MPSTMNLTGERRGSSARGSAASGLCDFDNSSITSGILIITFPHMHVASRHMHVASRVPDPSGSPTGSSGWTFTYRPLRGAAGCAVISALYSLIACLRARLRFRPSTLPSEPRPLGSDHVAISALYSTIIGPRTGGTLRIDRKSTRLNSSHLGISYA